MARYLSRLGKGGSRASRKVQNIALWGSNLPDGRKGAALERGRWEIPRGMEECSETIEPRRSSSDNVETLIFWYICARARTYIHSHALRTRYIHICVYVRAYIYVQGHPNRYTRRIKCISVTCGWVQKYKSRGRTKSGDHRQHAFYSRHSFFVRSSIREAVIQRNRRPRQRGKIKVATNDIRRDARDLFQDAKTQSEEAHR